MELVVKNGTESQRMIKASSTLGKSMQRSVINNSELFFT